MIFFFMLFYIFSALNTQGNLPISDHNKLIKQIFANYLVF